MNESQEKILSLINKAVDKAEAQLTNGNVINALETISLASTAASAYERLHDR